MAKLKKEKVKHVLAEAVKLLRREGIKVDDAYDFENFFTDNGSHSVLQPLIESLDAKAEDDPTEPTEKPPKTPFHPLQMYQITPDEKPKAGTTIYHRRLWLTVDGKLKKYDLCFFRDGDMRPGFNTSLHDPISKPCIKVWKLQKDRVRASIDASDRELLDDAERGGLYQEAVEKIVDEILVAIRQGEIKGAVSALTTAAECVLLSPYRTTLASDTFRYSDAGKRLERLAGRLMLADIEAKLGEEPAYVHLWKGPTE